MADFVMTKEEHDELNRMTYVLEQTDHDIETFDKEEWRTYGQLEMKFRLADEYGVVEHFEDLKNESN